MILRDFRRHRIFERLIVQAFCGDAAIAPNQDIREDKSGAKGACNRASHALAAEHDAAYVLALQHAMERIALGIERHPDEHEVFIRVALFECLQPRNLLDTACSIAAPEVEQHHLAAKVFGGDRAPVDALRAELRSRLADARERLCAERNGQREQQTAADQYAVHRLFQGIRLAARKKDSRRFVIKCAAVNGFSILWNPAGSNERVAQANLAAPLLLLGAANALPHYARLAHFGATQLMQERMNATPGGLYPSAAFLVMALTWLSPLLLPAFAVVSAWLLEYFVGFALDTKVSRAEMRRLTAWGFLPLAMQAVLAGIVVLACREDCTWFNPLASNAAFFLDPKQTSVFTYELARGADAFALWAIVILGIAIGARYERSPAAISFGVGVLYGGAVLARALLLG